MTEASTCTRRDRTPRRAILWLCALLTLAVPFRTAIANPCSGSGDGMGGTGISDVGETGGDGMGGTGIVGVITGFGSICVNGKEVHYDAGTAVQSDGVMQPADRLRIGQVVAIEADGSGNQFRARAIAILYDLAGTVGAVDLRRGELRIMGQTVSLGSLTRGSGNSRLPPSLQPGDAVRVSGLRGSGGRLVATLIESLPAGAPAQVRGMVTPGPGNTALVGGTVVRMAPDAGPADGSAVIVSGRWNGQTLEPARVTPDPVSQLAGRVARFDLQGYVQDSGTVLRVAGMPVQMSAATRFRNGRAAALAGGEPVIVSGPVTRGRIRAEEIRAAHPAATPAGAERPPGQGGTPIERREQPGQTEKPEKAEKTEWIEQVQHPVKHERPEKTEKPEKAERPEKAELPEKVERPEKIERPEKVERPEKIEKPEKVERPEKIEKPEKVERPEKIERPEKPERPEKIEKPEKPEKPEKSR